MVDIEQIASELLVTKRRCEELENIKHDIDFELKNMRALNDELREKLCTHMSQYGVAQAYADGYSFSIKSMPPKPIVINENALPECYIRIKREIDKAKINEDVRNGISVPGVHLDNGGVTLSVTAQKVKSKKIGRKEECQV